MKVLWSGVDVFSSMDWVCWAQSWRAPSAHSEAMGPANAAIARERLRANAPGNDTEEDIKQRQHHLSFTHTDTHKLELKVESWESPWRGSDGRKCHTKRCPGSDFAAPPASSSLASHAHNAELHSEETLTWGTTGCAGKDIFRFRKYGLTAPEQEGTLNQIEPT